MLIRKIQRRYKKPFKDEKEILKTICSFRELIRLIRKKRDASVRVREALTTSFRLANHFGFELGAELARRFPGYCSYCEKVTCICDTLPVKPKLRLLEFIPSWWRDFSLNQFQQNQKRTYPKPKGSPEHTFHFAEECLELIEAIFGKTPEDIKNSKDLDHIIEEVCDFFERVVSVASDFDVDVEMLFKKPA